MLRPLILSLLVLAAARVAAADETAGTTPATNASAMTQSEESTTKHRPNRAKKERAEKQAAIATAAGDAKTDPAAAGGEAAQPGGDVKMSGMSILGNEDAPKSLVLVPWKSSQLGDMPSVSRLLDSTTQPVDKDVFMRELSYYQYRSSSK